MALAPTTSPPPSRAPSAATSAPEKALRIYSGASFLGNASVEDRSWIFTPESDLATNRSHSFSARVADAAGNLGRPPPTHAG